MVWAKLGCSMSSSNCCRPLLMDLLLKLDPKVKKRQSNIQFPAVIMIYLMRVAAGLAFFWHIHPVILRSQSLMQLLGFNGRQIREGTSRRGHKPLQTNTPSESEGKQPTPIRGPMCPDSIACYMQGIAAYSLEASEPASTAAKSSITGKWWGSRICSVPLSMGHRAVAAMRIG